MRPAYIAGLIEESRNSAGLADPSRLRLAISDEMRACSDSQDEMATCGRRGRAACKVGFSSGSWPAARDAFLAGFLTGMRLNEVLALR